MLNLFLFLLLVLVVSIIASLLMAGIMIPNSMIRTWWQRVKRGST